MATNRTFNEIINIMDDVAGKMPEGNYLELYNKISDLKKICDSRQSQEARLESFREGYEEARSDLQLEKEFAVNQYKEKCARLAIENSEYKKELVLEQERFQEIYDLNRDSDEEIAKLKDDNKRLEVLLDQSNDEVEKQKAVVDDLKVRLKHFERYAEKRFKVIASKISLEKQLARHKMSEKIVELQKSVKVFEEEKRERVKAAADTAKPALVFAKKCKCGSTTHLRTNHKDCRLNKANAKAKTTEV